MADNAHALAVLHADIASVAGSDAVPFMYVHAAGFFFAFVQDVCECAIKGIQYITFGTCITLMRAVYMGVSNYL
jgi:hypothetical protein|eukprot:SAG25_NODE_3760_length_978_cov_1.232082_2_plen_74_part_00